MSFEQGTGAPWVVALSNDSDSPGFAKMFADHRIKTLRLNRKYFTISIKRLEFC